MQETQLPSLGWEDTLEEGMSIHSSILAWRIPWTEESGGLQSIGSHRVGHDKSDLVHSTHRYICIYFPCGTVVKNMSSISGSGRSPGVGNGNPLQYSCLENSRDRRAWQATVHMVAESDTTEHALLARHISWDNFVMEKTQHKAFMTVQLLEDLLTGEIILPASGQNKESRHAIWVTWVVIHTNNFFP